MGTLNLDVVNDLRRENPDVRFRLHANARVSGWSSQADAASLDQHEDYFHGLFELSEAINAPTYTWHAGLRRNAGLDRVLWRTRALQDSMGIPVGIEGMYPTTDDRYLLSTWAEYATLLKSGTAFALDLSHIHILATKSGRNDPLLADLLASPACIEIHISGNDGTGDQHGRLSMKPWWWSTFLANANPLATVFTEGNQVRGALF
jgi:hypothetical protein